MYLYLSTPFSILAVFCTILRFLALLLQLTPPGLLDGVALAVWKLYVWKQ